MSTDGPQVIATVVIPCYKRADLVRKAVVSALNQSVDPRTYEVLVVDSSPDDSVALAMEELRADAKPHIELYRKSPEGPGPSRNMGAQNGRGEFIAFLDSDCEATAGWLAAALAAFREGIGIVQGRTLPDPSSPQGVFTHTIRVEAESHLYETANIVYRRKCFEEAGGFMVDWNPNAITPLGGEDVDLAWRAKRLGWATAFAPDALVYHAVLPMRGIAWVWIDRLQVFPWLAGKYPELRSYFYARYFYDKAQALILAAVSGLLLALVSFWFLLAILPYVVFRASEPTRTLRGPLRLLRPAFYAFRDISSLIILLAGSFRARSLVI